MSGRARQVLVSLLIALALSEASAGYASTAARQRPDLRDSAAAEASGGSSSPRAQEPQSEAAELEALLKSKLESNGYLADPQLEVLILDVIVEPPYALLGYYIAMPGNIPTSFSPQIALGVQASDGWQVLVAEVDRLAFNAVLEAIPETMLAGDAKPVFFYYAPGDAGIQATYSGHYLPWPTGDAWPVTQWPLNCGSHCAGNGGAYAYDFGVPYGRALWASKTGTVAYAVDDYAASPLTWNPDWNLYCSSPSSPANYVVINHDQGASLYLHIRQYSIPGGLVPGATWRRGNRVGESGNVGYVCSYDNTPTSGAHLHYQVQAQGYWWTQSGTVDFVDWNESSSYPASANTPEADPSCSAPSFAPDAVRAAVIGDFGIAGQPEGDVAARVASWAPDLVLTVGDNNYPKGESATIDANIGQYYRQFICPYLGSYGAGGGVNRFFPALGNHDWIAPDAQPHLDYFSLPGNERYYDFVAGPVHFFVVDADPSEPDGNTAASTQAAWLQGGLAASTSAWNVVLMHQAPYSSGPHGSTPWAQWPYAAWGADAVLAGHDHTYERLLRDGIAYFVNGLGGAGIYNFPSIMEGSQRRYNADHGAMLLAADSKRMTFKFITHAGIVIDSYTLGPRMPTRSDYDGDEASDPVKFLPGTGKAWWYRSSTSTWDGKTVGTDGIYVPRSDFDGDGRSDPAKFVEGQQALWYFESNLAAWQSRYMGPGTYSLVVASDFDGDGKTDPAKHVTADGSLWYRSSSSGQWVGEFIGSDAAPVLAGSDYDGDGTSDVAKYVPAAGAIWYHASSDGLWHGIYIGSDGSPVPGSDFDGDGITDAAKVLSGANSLWYRESSTGEWKGVYLGSGNLQYVPAADFDGDGKTDPATYNPAAHDLRHRESTTGLWHGQWMGDEEMQLVN